MRVSGIDCLSLQLAFRQEYLYVAAKYDGLKLTCTDSGAGSVDLNDSSACGWPKDNWPNPSIYLWLKLRPLRPLKSAFGILRTAIMPLVLNTTCNVTVDIRYVQAQKLLNNFLIKCMFYTSC